VLSGEVAVFAKIQQIYLR